MGHDTNHAVRRLVELDRPADDGGVRTEMGLPHPVAEHEHAMLRRDRLLGRERAAEERTRTQRVEEVRRRHRDGRLEGLLTGGQSSLVVGVRGEILERVIACAPVLKVRRRDRIARLQVQPIVLPQHHEASGIVVRQRTKQHGVQCAEDRGRRADANREREDDEEGVDGAPCEEARAVANVLAEHVEAPLLSEQVPRIRHGAEGAGERRVGRELRFPLGAELAARGAGRQPRDESDEPPGRIRHGAHPIAPVRDSRSASWRQRARRCRPA